MSDLEEITLDHTNLPAGFFDACAEEDVLRMLNSYQAEKERYSTQRNPYGFLSKE